MIRDIPREIKWAYQRAVRGYDETIMWGFDGYFDYFVPPLKKFCEQGLSEKEYMKLNPKLKRIFTETLKRIEDYENTTSEQFYDVPNPMDKLWKYVGAHIGYYWT